MDLRELCKKRYSVRAYLPQSIEQEKIDYILECAQLAPSATNGQPWKFYVVTTEIVKEKVRISYNREWFKTAPMYIVVCKDNTQSWKRSAADGKDFGDVDAAIASEHICLAAVQIGLGTCWVCNFRPDVLSLALNLSSEEEPIAIFPIGYVDEAHSKTVEKTRKPISDTTRWL